MKYKKKQWSIHPNTQPEALVFFFISFPVFRFKPVYKDSC